VRVGLYGTVPLEIDCGPARRYAPAPWRQPPAAALLFPLICSLRAPTPPSTTLCFFFLFRRRKLSTVAGREAPLHALRMLLRLLAVATLAVGVHGT
jgi:hypothetical protein